MDAHRTAARAAEHLLGTDGTMTTRHAHLVGSLPGEDAGAAMALAAERLGGLLTSVPDGETGVRRNWVISMVEGLREHPDLTLARQGDWSDYDAVPRLKVRRGHRFTGDTVDLGLVEAALLARPAFESLRATRTGPDGEPPRFQVGIPGDVDLALFTFGPTGSLRHRAAFTDALADAMQRISAVHYGDVLFQLEIPAEVVLLSRAPRPLRRPLAALLARAVAGLAARAPHGAHLGLHLCLGDMNHKAFGRIPDCGPLVRLTNAIAHRWPAGRTLRYVHLPLAHADEPPSTEPAFYAPLSGLRLPAGTRVVAGFAHEEQDADVQRRIRGIVDEAVGTPVDVSTSCGLGRRPAAAARAALDRIALLTQG